MRSDRKGAVCLSVPAKLGNLRNSSRASKGLQSSFKGLLVTYQSFNPKKKQFKKRRSRLSCFSHLRVSNRFLPVSFTPTLTRFSMPFIYAYDAAHFILICIQSKLDARKWIYIQFHLFIVFLCAILWSCGKQTTAKLA